VHELDVQRHNIDCAIKRILVNKAIDGCNERIMVGWSFDGKVFLNTYPMVNIFLEGGLENYKV
jgi:hypothetical protein